MPSARRSSAARRWPPARNAASTSAIVLSSKSFAWPPRCRRPGKSASSGCAALALVRPPPHLRVLAHRPHRRQGRSPDRGGRTGRTGTQPQRARASPVRRLRRADRRLRAGRHAGLCQCGSAGSALRRHHAVGAGHRNARRDRRLKPAAPAAPRALAKRLSKSPPHASAKTCPACCCSPCGNSRAKPLSSRVRHKGSSKLGRNIRHKTWRQLQPRRRSNDRDRDLRCRAHIRSRRPARGHGGAAASVAVRLAHGCRRPLRRRVGRIHRTRRAPYEGGIRPAMERNRRRTEARSQQSSRAGGGESGNLERHRRALAGRRFRRTAADRIVRPAGI